MLAIKIRNLKKTYRGDVTALKGIDLDVQQGDFFALLGPNGAGKSTTIGIICHLVNSDSGTVEIFGNSLETHWQEAKCKIGIVPQEFNFNIFETTIQVLCNQAGYYGIPRKLALQRAEHYLKKLDIWDKRDTQSRFLSGGMKRRLMIARAMVHEPQLLILDEPTAGVDIELRRLMWDFFKEINVAGVTIILTTHYLEETESLCRNIAIIDQGQIIENTSVKTLLTKLDTETFVLDLKKKLKKAPQFASYSAVLTSDSTLEIEVSKKVSLNRLFADLTEKKIEVASMRNKTNRLEELFLKLVQDGKQ